MLLPLLVATTLAHGVTVLTLHRSILTEKVSRRGYHLSREYAIDPLEILFVREVMRTNVVALSARLSIEELTPYLHRTHSQNHQRLYPVVEEKGNLLGVVTKSNMHILVEQSRNSTSGNHQLADIVETHPVVAYSDEPLRVVVYRMAETGLTRLPVVERGGTRLLLGMISLHDLLTARVRNLEAERRRERVLPLSFASPRHMYHFARRRRQAHAKNVS